MKPYQNILHMIPMGWFAYHGIDMFIRGFSSDVNLEICLKIFSIPLIIGIIGIIVGFVFDGVRKIILRKKAQV